MTTTSDTLPPPTVLPPDTPVADILDAAAGTLAARGKCTGNFADDQGRVCAFGALRLVMFGSPEVQSPQSDAWNAYMAAGGALHQHLQATFGEDTPTGGVAEWSDLSSQDDVVAGIRAAAERARAASR